MTIYKINLSKAERTTLSEWVSKGSRKAKDIQKAYVLLASDEQTGRESETALADTYHLSTRSVERIRKAFCEQGMAIFDKQQRKIRSDKKIDGKVEAHLLALVCSEPPQGQAKWKLQLLADRLVELQVIDSISHTSVAGILKKMSLDLNDVNLRVRLG
ncbi:helix-turn-helix domain-containing protein [Rhodocytophaga rosea]|uniref:Helix-turn-helix domain-containing protein n=1 Tax=Rhodocytophaga rosea TaxID=2704465 RepID=A0A6C0GJR4_9BACT|nr:helix-turn-helix domain-containing protein [Rhodocytophaga rosea]QHT68054.1 helix-turn-helix domain-containing protein [Rhodocytophaga rosea]